MKGTAPATTKASLHYVTTDYSLIQQKQRHNNDINDENNDDDDSNNNIRHRLERRAFYSVNFHGGARHQFCSVAQHAAS